MSKTGGGSWVCLALLGLGACSSPAAPPAEGSAQVTFSGCNFPPQSISGPGGTPSGAKVGANQTVLDGRNGYSVQCTVSQNGSSYSVSATIVGPDMTLSVQNGTVKGGSGTATMSFLTTQSINTYTSNPGTSPAPPPCNLTTASTTTGLTVMPGSIWATYNCPQVVDPITLSNTCSTSGFIVFTGCNT